MSKCSICGEPLSDNPLAGPAHAKKHKNEFEEIVGRPPNSYEEVRALLLEGEVPDDVDVDVGELATLDEFAAGGDE